MRPHEWALVTENTRVVVTGCAPSVPLQAPASEHTAPITQQIAYTIHCPAKEAQM